jgi:hypothetical protein
MGRSTGDEKVSNDLWWTEVDEGQFYVIEKSYFFLYFGIFLFFIAAVNALTDPSMIWLSRIWVIAGTVCCILQYLANYRLE